MPSSYPGRHMPLPRLEPSTSGKRWVSVANWATPVGFFFFLQSTNQVINHFKILTSIRFLI
ncbi:hypothetical protein HanXRQr2_Chr12g0561461 [Helianthus annuus]|uniref:Uncharacterized protein n=1 Tax=Helianthus annuus TaxID=4232 RepID=A0A9K3MXR7_HELAN|nr:hypothetical protein HanXRQr2_Chr12g0561461 [Helianthus annuus]KAJ0864349.1 hypothetical protein HanPSC8_Chr12g0540901 [Helianthus annuus]